MFTDNNFFVVMGFMINKLKLSGNELICYAIIYGFAQAEGNEFKGSLNYLAQAMNVTKDNARKILGRLVEKGYITKKENFVNGVKFCSYSANMRGVTEIVPLSLNQLQGGTKTVPGDTETVTGGGTETVPNNNIVYNNNSLSNSAHESEISLSSVVSLIEYYNKRIKDTGRRLHSVANISSELRRLIIEGIRQHGVVDVHKAIEIATTPGNWCMDNNKTLFFILAEDKIERILMGEYDNTTKSNNNENSNCNNSSRPEQRPTTEERQAHYRDYIAERIATGRSLSGEIPDSEMPF